MTKSFWKLLIIIFAGTGIATLPLPELSSPGNAASSAAGALKTVESPEPTGADTAAASVKASGLSVSRVSQSVPSKETAANKPAEEDQQGDLEKKIQGWITALTAEKDFASWKNARWDITPLGPGTHSWLVSVTGGKEDAGYLIVAQKEDGSYTLVEYGSGTYPLFSLQTLRQSLLRRGLMDSLTESHECTESATRFYIRDLEAFWKVTCGGNTIFFDAKTGEELPDLTRYMAAGQTNTSVNPASTSTDPASTSVNPANTSADPASTSVNPASTSTDPASTSVNPANTSVNPANTSADPASTSVNPDSTSTDPASTSTNHANLAGFRIPANPAGSVNLANSPNPDSSVANSSGPAAVKDRFEAPSFDPFDHPDWMKEKTRAAYDFTSLTDKIKTAGNMTYVIRLYGGQALYPFAVTGYHRWSDGAGYVRLEHEGARYVRFPATHRGTFH
jgi:hypothetical protein